MQWRKTAATTATTTCSSRRRLRRKKIVWDIHMLLYFTESKKGKCWGEEGDQVGGKSKEGNGYYATYP